ncbi:unnamed protein product, partial [Leptidea sinapis]
HRGRKIIRVQCYSPKSHHELKNGLAKEKVAFHTYTRKDEKLPKAVIKGLPKYVHTTIPEELASLGFSGVTVTEIKTVFPSECPPLLAQLQVGAATRAKIGARSWAQVTNSDPPGIQKVPKVQIDITPILNATRSDCTAESHDGLSLKQHAHDLDNVFAASPKVLAMGDLNSKHPLWSPGRCNYHGKKTL